MEEFTRDDGTHAQLDELNLDTDPTETPGRQNYLHGLSRPQFESPREATQSFHERVDGLSRQAAALSREIDDLKWTGLGVKRLSVEDGLDFYQEIKQFEISLIVQALKITHGSQKKAAALLQLESYDTEQQD